jgi:hypothetical protein
MRIPISTAAFCEDCQCFVDSLAECECGSKALLPMANVLNRASYADAVCRVLGEELPDEPDPRIELKL